MQETLPRQPYSGWAALATAILLQPCDLRTILQKRILNSELVGWGCVITGVCVATLVDARELETATAKAVLKERGIEQLESVDLRNMECPVCREKFNLTDHRPKNIPCGQTMCITCVKSISIGGEFTCPIDNYVYAMQDGFEFPDSYALISMIEETLVMCSQHCSVEATHFCPTHFLSFCDAHPHMDDCQLVEMGEQVKFILMKAMEDYDVQRIPHTLRSKVEQKFKLSLKELIAVNAAIREAGNSLCCVKCQSLELYYVNFREITLYCSTCYEGIIAKDHEMVVNFVPFSEECCNYIYSEVLNRLRRIDFCYLTLSHYKWMFFQPTDFSEYMKQAKEIAELENRPRLDEHSLPEYFLCPNCKKVFDKREYTFRRLPCQNVFHAICNECASKCLTSVKCPLDQQEFNISGELLTKFEQITCCPDPPVHEDSKEEEPAYPSNIPFVPCPVYNAAPQPQPVAPERRRIGSNLPLANVGVVIPPFQRGPEVPAGLPREKLEAVDRFLMVLPPLETVEPNSEEDRSFMEPWYINFFRQLVQVEVLTFRPYTDVSLWGIGIANPTIPGAIGIVEWVRLYKEDKAIGSDYVEMRLANNQLRGGLGVITDVYFLDPYQIPTLMMVTMKVKLGRPGNDPDSQDKLPIYHGNHIGRYEDIVGTDSNGWEASQTYSVETFERNSGQQHFIGPLLRLIYQSKP